jgi:hypothetical protein
MGGFVGRSLFMMGGLIVWAVHFGAIYMFNAIVCARGVAGTVVMGVGIVPLGVGAMTVLALLAAAALAIAGYRRSARAKGGSHRASDEFIDRLAMTVAALALVAIIWNTVPGFVLPPCS